MSVQVKKIPLLKTSKNNDPRYILVNDDSIWLILGKVGVKHARRDTFARGVENILILFFY